jgi:hypothetical protein
MRFVITNRLPFVCHVADSVIALLMFPPRAPRGALHGMLMSRLMQWHSCRSKDRSKLTPQHRDERSDGCFFEVRRQRGLMHSRRLNARHGLSLRARLRGIAVND